MRADVNFTQKSNLREIMFHANLSNQQIIFRLLKVR